MRRVSVKLLLAGCGVLLLAIEGCWSRTGLQRNTHLVAARDEGDEKESKKVEKGPPFRLPDDAAGRLLGEVLPPAAPPGPLNNPTRLAPPAVPLPRLAEPP